jgi:hypothetical protein
VCARVCGASRTKVKKTNKNPHHHLSLSLYLSLSYLNFKNSKLKQGVCHNVALPFTLKSILRQKKNYGNSNISPCKIIIFKKPSKRKQKSFKILQLYNKSQVSTQTKTSSFKNAHMKIDLLLPRGQDPLSYCTL